MQKVQILHGSPTPTFLLTTAAAARELALEKILRTNLIADGDCEISGKGHWADYGTPAANALSTTQVKTGDGSRKFTPNAANEGVQSDPFTTITGLKYYHTFWVYPNDGTVVSVILRQGDNLANLYDEVHSGLTEDAWNEITIEVTELSGGDGGYLVAHSGAQTSGDFYVDNFFSSRMVQPGQHSGRRATCLYITVDADEMLWTTGGVAPVQSGLGHKLFPGTATNPRCEIVLQNYDAIRTFQYISHDGSNHAKLYVNVEF